MALTEQKFLQGGTGATNRNVTDKLKEFVSVKDFGAVGDGVADDTVAFQTALAFGKFPNNKIVFIPSGRYKITDTLLIGQHQIVFGESPVDGGSELWFYGADGANCFESDGAESAEKSRCEVRGIRILDKRTSPTSGWGIELFNVDNRTLIENCFIGLFPSGQIYVGAPVAKAADCIQIRDCWVTSTIENAIGIKLERVENNIVIDTLYADIVNGTVIDLSNITNDNAVISINNVKHEANNASYSANYRTINVGQGHGNLLISNVVQRNSIGTGCDIVQIADSTASRMQIINVTGDQHLVPTTAPYTLNSLAPFAQTFNGRIDNALAGTSGRIVRRLCGNGSPESTLHGWVGEVYNRLDGGASSALYFKSSGAGTNTGWLPVCGFLSASTTVDLPPISSGSSTTTNITVTGAAVGDVVLVGYGGSGSSLLYTGQVTSTNTVAVTISNLTGVSVDPLSQSIYVRVFK